jgi:DNA-binding NarL/FixJ family response regulator
LRPDLIVLDVSLPKLNGLEVAGRIRALNPSAKLMFVSVESSLDIVEQAFNTGAHGYVYKPRAYRDVLPILDAIVSGGRFVSGGLARIAQGDSLASHRHPVLFYSSDDVVLAAFSRFIASALDDEKSVLVLVTEAHAENLQRSLHAAHVDVARAIREGRYRPVNIAGLLAKVMVNGFPDPLRFVDAAEDLVGTAVQRVSTRHPKVAACGECAPSLWAQGHCDAAIQLEHLWDGLAQRLQIDTYCAYPMAVRDEHAQTVRSLCAEHTAVEIR